MSVTGKGTVHTLKLPRWFAMTVFPFETESVRGHIIQAPAPSGRFHRELPLPLFYRMPGHPDMDLAGVIDHVYVDGDQLRAAGKFDHATRAGTHLAFRLLCGEQIPIAGQTDMPAFEYHLAEMLQQQSPGTPMRLSGWVLVGIVADPPGGSGWDDAVMWRV